MFVNVTSPYPNDRPALGHPAAPTSVLPLGQRAEVLGVPARSPATDVVHVKPRSKVAAKQYVGDDVGAFAVLCSGVATSYVDPPIAVAVAVTNPVDMAVRGDDAVGEELVKQALSGRIVWARDDARTTQQKPSGNAKVESSRGDERLSDSY